MSAITFTAIEAEVLEHRLSHLAELDADELGDLFPDHQDAGALEAVAAELAEAFRESSPVGGGLIVQFRNGDALLLLVEALEGSTLHEMAKEAQGAGAVSPQKRAAYRKAMQSAAEKIAPLAGKEIELP